MSPFFFISVLKSRWLSDSNRPNARPSLVPTDNWRTRCTLEGKSQALWTSVLSDTYGTVDDPLLCEDPIFPFRYKI